MSLLDTDFNNGLSRDQAETVKSDKTVKRVGVMGGGLVGGLAASMLALRGFEVDLYEYRSDIRNDTLVQGRSINMALAKRGMAGLEKIGLLDTVLEHSIPMYSRMIHNLDGTTFAVPYGKTDECIYSIERTRINELLLTAAEAHPKVNLHFEHKMTAVDVKKTEASFDTPSGPAKQSFDVIVSADGAFSKIRQQFMRSSSFNYSQTYIDSLYIELSIEPDETGKTKMPLNHLHIWPRGSFMLIGLPNLDNSWTLTLFAPKALYGNFESEQGVMKVFRENFPDAIPLIGEKRLIKECVNATGYPMVSIKCDPHVMSQTILLGDSAHSMVPFYGEGMNCGFEDCVVLDELIEEQGNLIDAMAEYTGRRADDTHAMCDLAMYNYIEMRDLVNSPLFQLRKVLDNALFTLVPNQWVPLYTSIRFQRKMGYRQCLNNKVWQSEVVNRVISGVFVLLAGCVAYCVKSMLS